VLVIAVIKNGDVQLTPSAQTVLEAGDIVAVCGTLEQRHAFELHINQPVNTYVLTATRE
jgi:K+/H+ antiporter YhaU regulatory subunit KhtT